MTILTVMGFHLELEDGFVLRFTSSADEAMIGVRSSEEVIGIFGQWYEIKFSNLHFSFRLYNIKTHTHSISAQFTSF
jgi:hypothetical protein